MNESLAPLTTLVPGIFAAPPPSGWNAQLDFTLSYADGDHGPPDEQMWLPKPFCTTVEEPLRLSLPETIHALRYGWVRVKSRTVSSVEAGGVLHTTVASFSPHLRLRVGELRFELAALPEWIQRISQWTTRVEQGAAGSAPGEVLIQSRDAFARQHFKGLSKEAARRFLTAHGIAREFGSDGLPLAAPPPRRSRSGWFTRPPRARSWPKSSEATRRRSRPRRGGDPGGGPGR